VLGVVLYGPPASGKDTVTRALETLSPAYVHFPRLKVGGGSTATYRMTTTDQLHDLRLRGDLVWENHRYGATYAIDREGLLHALGHHVPVVHLGQPGAILAVRAAAPAARWLVVELWCPRDDALRRLRGRGSTDIQDRLRAWDETYRLTDADMTLNTVAMSPEQAATAIHASLVEGLPSHARPRNGDASEG
jgi:guanylate kinase